MTPPKLHGEYRGIRYQLTCSDMWYFLDPPPDKWTGYNWSCFTTDDEAKMNNEIMMHAMIDRAIDGHPMRYNDNRPWRDKCPYCQGTGFAPSDHIVDADKKIVPVQYRRGVILPRKLEEED